MTLRQVSFWVLLLDQVSKTFVMKHFQLNESFPLVPNILYVTYIHNTGAAFGFLAEAKSAFRIPFFIAITLGAGLIVYSFQRFIPEEKKLSRFALGLVWGGAMGNFVDRLLYGKVVDFIDVGHIPFPFGLHFSYVFNVADSCITVGLTLLICNYLFGKNESIGGGG